MPLRLTALAAALILAGSVHAADRIKVGFVSTLSGPGAGLGVDIRDGFNLAIKQLDGKLGGLPAEVIVADDQQSPDVAKQAVDKFLKKDKVDFMTGIVFSNIMLAVGPTVFENQDLLHLGQCRPLAVRRRAVQSLLLQRRLAERQPA